MSLWKMAMACSLTVGVMTGQIGQVSAAPMPTNVATMKAAAGDDVTQVHWRGGGWGWGLGGFAAGAIIGSAIANNPPPPPPPAYYPPPAAYYPPPPGPYAELGPGCYWTRQRVWVEGYGYRWRSVPVCP
jgi:hypothetical protein